ncbi:uncharacterized protein LOC132193750 [Neocloeon triangulifer]|uniref:uncharacterized protein LOC132193750 n=1 Tax=Neocloeon triangulifer TaxID=2078957 RepID=UPI00286FA2F6|nr:uncharacterized protein LOC132193750 [Neocloeon triangulifer]
MLRGFFRAGQQVLQTAKQRKFKVGRFYSYSSVTSRVYNSSDMIDIDFRSDTVTKPTDAMRQAMASAVVGDDVYEEDPTVQKLERKSAEMIGMEAALYVPSGTMSNLIAALTHCNQRGCEMITGDKTHMFLYEQAGVCQFGGVSINTVKNLPDGTFDLAEMQKHIRSRDLHEPTTALICVENTHNKCGGRVLPLSWLDELVEISKKRNLPLHMDGARIYNAAVYLGVPAKRIVRGFSSVSVCLSKGLGAPVGSILHGPKEFIARARRLRKALGGGMRQCGIIAAAGIVSLDSMIDRLAVDHANGLALAKGIAALNHPLFKVVVDSMQTNILVFEVDPKRVDAKEFCAKLQETTDEQLSALGGKDICVKAVPFEAQLIRLVINHHITAEMVDLALQKIAVVMKEYN